jgi:hypothetical protein
MPSDKKPPAIQKSKPSNGATETTTPTQREQTLQKEILIYRQKRFT